MVLHVQRIGDEERRVMHLVPAPAVKLMKSRVLSRPGMKKCLGSKKMKLKNQRDEEKGNNRKKIIKKMNE